MVAYTCVELLEDWHGAGVSSAHIQKEICRSYHRRKRAGVKVRGRNKRDRTFKPFLPLVIMGNLRSLANKTDELTALVNSQRAYRKCRLLCSMETWLNGNIADTLLELASFTLVQADRGKQSGK